MALLKNRRTSPPGGWTHFQSETGATIKGENEDQLIDLVVAHRTYRGLMPIDREEVRKDIERQICVRLGLRECKSEGRDDKWTPQDGSKPLLTMSKMLAFSKAAFSFLKSGCEVVPLEEVKRRAAICLACPMSSGVSGCSCDIFYKTVDSFVPQERRTPGLGVCLACGCSTVAKTNLTEEQVHASNEGRDIAWPTDVPCWQASIERKFKAQA